MNTRRNKSVTVYANVGVAPDTAIEAKLAAHSAEAIEINIGYSPELIIDCADVESLERLSAVATEGARLLRERIAQNRSAAAEVRADDTDRLAGAGVAR